MTLKSPLQKYLTRLVLCFFTLFLVEGQGFSQLTSACSPSYPSGSGSWYITAVSINSFSHSPSSSQHDYTTQSFSANAGDVLTMTVTTTGWLSVGTAADWNNDGDFDDAGEALDIQPYVANSPATYNYSVTIPPTILTGSYRFRLWTVGGNSGDGAPVGSPCGTYGYGNWVDYTINVTNNSGCQPPSVVVAGNVQPTSVDFSWNTSTSNPSNGYFWKIVEQGDDPDVVSGVASGTTTDTFAQGTGLTPAEGYQIYVLSLCGNDSSLWSIPKGLETPCDGTPSAGSISSSADQVYLGSSYTLNIVGASIPVNGISYQWQSTPSGQNTWTNVANGNDVSLGQTMQGTTDYRFIVSCSGSGLSDTSAVKTIFLRDPDYVSVALSGFNADVIANGIGSASNSTNNDVDGVSYALVAEDFQATPTGPHPTKFLPNSRIIQNQEKQFILNDYSQNNSLRLTSNNSGTLFFLTPKQAKEVHILGVSGSGNSTVTASIYFNDGTVQTATSLSWPDWFATTGDLVASQVGRISINNNNLEAGTGPNLIQNTINITAANQNKQIDSIGFEVQPNSNVMNVLAISVVANDNPSCATPSGLTASNVQDHSATISWNGNGTTNNYEVSYGLPGIAAANGTIETVNNDSTINLTGLIDNTLYNVFVRANCGANDFSDWIGPLEFQTTLVNCVGTPSAGQLDTVDFGICATNPFNITASGFTVAGGVSYQWQENVNNGGWTNIAGATTDFLEVSNGISDETQYRFYAVCSFSNSSDTSDAITVSINPANQCYCDVTSTNSGTYGISNFQTTGGVTNIDNPSSGGPYSDYTNMAVSQFPNMDISFTITSAYSTAGMAIWIDWNNDGAFDASEKVYNSGSYVASGTGTFTIPLSALPGDHRMRVVANYLSTNPTPCGDLGNGSFGEAEDYTFTVIPLDACTGPVTAGSIDQGPTLGVCSDVDFDLDMIGTTGPAADQHYYWQKSEDNGATWSDIAAFTDHLNITTSISIPTMFRFIVECELANATDTSDAITVSINPANQCYCDVTSTNTTYGIAEFKTTDGYINIDNTSGPGTYTDYTNQFVSIDAGGTINFEITGVNTSQGYGIWVDWNGDGSFSGTGEQVYNSGSYQNGATGSITVPLNVDSGNYRMRVVGNWLSNNPTPCGDLGSQPYGEAEDYTFNVIILDDCNGAVTAGNIGNDTTLCANTAFSVSVTGYSAPANGLTYQWQQSDDNGVTWTNITGAVGPTAVIANGVSDETQFRMYVVCSLSNTSDTSDVITVSMSPGIDCYCQPTGAGNNTDDIANFTLANLNNSSTSGTSTTSSGYSDFTGTVAPADLIPFQSYIASVTAGIGSGNHGAAIWIDYNDNGIFETSEMVTSLPSSIAGGATASFPAFSVENAPGTHRLRIQYAYSNAGAGLVPCTVPTTYGETEDYLVDIIPLTPCAGQPDAGEIDFTETEICANTPFSLTDTGFTIAGDMTYQWQENVNNGGWNDIAGANTASLAVPNGITDPTQYRFYIVCDNSSLADTTDIVSLAITPGNECYCDVTSTNTSYGISNVTTTGGILNINNTSGPGTYSDYTDSVVSAVIGDTVDFVITGVSTSEGYGLWIDWNNDGSFDGPGEEIANSNGSYQSNLSGSIIVPQDAVPGNLRMRAVGNWLSSTPIPCDDLGSQAYGEAEDYTFNVIPNCDTPIVDLGADQTGCNGVAITLDAGNPGLTYEWSDGSTSQTLDVDQDGTYTVTVFDGLCFASDSIQVSFEDPVEGTGISAVHNSDDSYTFTVDDPANINNYLWDFGDNAPNSTSTNANPTYFYGAFGDYTVTVIISNGCNSDTLQTVVHFGTDDGTGINDINVTKDNLKLFPNPAKDIITIENHSASQMEAISVVNVLGQVIYRGDVENATKTHLNVANYAAGVYMVHIQTNKGTVVRKFEILK